MSDPILGSLYPNERRCLRVRRWGLCLRPSQKHIIWHGSDASTACDECFQFALSNRSMESSHPMGPDCGMVGTMYFEDEDTCRPPGSAEDIRRGRIVF